MGSDDASVLRATSILAILAACVLAGEHARADEPPSIDRERLAKLASDGAKAARAKQWEVCIDAYTGAVQTGAVQIEETPVRLGELGLCEEAHGQRDVDAYHHLDAALNAPGVDRKVDPYKRYSVAFERVGKRVAEAYVSVDPPQATLLVNGEPVGKWDGRTLILKPGHYDFAAQLKGYIGKSDARDLVGNQRAEVFLRLEREPAPAATASPVAPRPTASTQLSISTWFLARPERITLAVGTGLAAFDRRGQWRRRDRSGAAPQVDARRAGQARLPGGHVHKAERPQGMRGAAQPLEQRRRDRLRSHHRGRRDRRIRRRDGVHLRSGSRSPAPISGSYCQPGRRGNRYRRSVVA